MTPWMIVAGDFTPLGGMDAANHALARYLAASGVEVHLVTHRAWPDLSALAPVTVHRVWRPFGRHLLGSPLLAREGGRVWRRLQRRHGHALVNGGNCRLPSANWVHYLHAAYAPAIDGSLSRRAKGSLAHRRDLEAERAALLEAPLVVANSQRTKRDIVERLGVPERRVHVVYYGSDPIRFGPVSLAQRTAAKAAFGLAGGRPVVGFIGALGDRRKGFDTLFEAWTTLCADPAWDADLAVVGSGAELPDWRQRALASGMADRLRFFGFRQDVPDLMAAFDAVVHPARYEAYGLGVHEALCRGIPAIVSASAGVAERYSRDLTDLLIDNPDDPGEVCGRLRAWRAAMEQWRTRTAALSPTLLVRTWDSMASELAALVERAA